MSESGGSAGSQAQNSAFGDPANVYEAMAQVRPEAVVVYCGDPRLQTAFEPFIEKGLKLPKGQYIPLVVGGGAGVLANPERLPKEFKFMKDRFELIHRHLSHLGLRAELYYARFTGDDHSKVAFDRIPL